MPAQPATVEPVILEMEDGVKLRTYINPDTKIHHVVCDLCDDDITLTVAANPYRLLAHRKGKMCSKNLKTDHLVCR